MSAEAHEVDLGPLYPTLGVHVVFLSVSQADETFVRVLRGLADFDPAGPACADAEDNSLAGAMNGCDAFPTGHTHAPAHAGCRCAIVPVQN